MAESLAASGAKYEVREFEASTKSSALAAQVLGCTVAEIAKSVVFVGGRTAVVITSGDKRVSIKKLADAVGEDFRVANPDEVRERTGFPIGGVPPFPHNPEVVVLPDRSLTRFEHAWAAAGSPNAVFKIGTHDLLRIVGPKLYDLSE